MPWPRPANATAWYGKDLAEEMVKAGYANDWPKFSGGYRGRLNEQTRYERGLAVVGLPAITG